MSERVTFDCFGYTKKGGKLACNILGEPYLMREDEVKYAEIDRRTETPVRVRVTVEIIEPGSVLGAEAPAGGKDGA